MGYYLEGDGYKVDGVTFKLWVPGLPVAIETKKDQPEPAKQEQKEGDKN